ncbi:HpcH/HpaI aldolase family protein [Elioraea sp.]|uniref:HpcH/HpaI aldolase family protein n=1 Tax=Elioraea sp. TaxID=2185103 RepID=UPI003F71172D
MDSHGGPAQRLNRLRILRAEDRCALGAIATIPSPQTVQILAASGLDFIIIDMEHGPIGPTEAHAMIAATSGTMLGPLVRVAATTPWHATVPIDLGAMGVCFPLLSTRDDAEAAVRAVRYPPAGVRAWGPFDAPPRWGLSPRDCQDRADAVVLSNATIEHVWPLETIGEVVAVPGLDLAFIGPGDLATSMGHRGRVDHPEVQAVAVHLEKVIRDSPVVLGGVAPMPEQANAMIVRGYRALVVGFDWSLLQRGAEAASPKSHARLLPGALVDAGWRCFRPPETPPGLPGVRHHPIS